VVALNLADIGRVDAQFGGALAQQAREAFTDAAVALGTDFTLGEQLLAMTTSEPGTVEIFLVPARDHDQGGPGYLEKACEAGSEQVERQLRQDARMRDLGLLRVVGGHAAQLLARGGGVYRQIDQLRGAALAQLGTACARRKAKDKFELQRVILNNLI